MPYIGRGLTSGAQYQKLDAITIDNATTFTMQVSSTAVTPPQEHVILAVNGVLQEPGVGFTVAGSTCTLASAIDNDGGTDTIWGVVAGAAAFNNGLFGNTVTVGEDDTGYDVKFFGATSGDFLLWDESADQLVLSGTMKIKEQADADSDTAAYGQLWVNTATPNELYFTTDAGNDIAITSGTAIAAAATIDDLSDAVSGITNFTNSLILGHQTTGTLSSADQNTAVGYAAMDAITQGDDNTIMGYNAGSGITTGSDNTLIGSGAGDALTTMTDNVAVGLNALGGSSLVDKTVVIGSGAGAAAMTADADGTVAIGYQAGAAITQGQFNTAIGYEALATENLNGNYNTAVGYQALKDNDTADGGNGNNTGIGALALANNTTGEDNTAVGYNAIGVNAVTGANNVGLGKAAAYSLTSGANNVAVGKHALATHTTGARNIAIGTAAMSDTSADADSLVSQDNIFIGEAAGGGTWGNGQTNSNVAVGNYAMDAVLTNSPNNVAIGYQALSALTSGNNNTCVGYQAGDADQTGSLNVLIGSGADVDSTASASRIVLGPNANGGSDNYARVGDNNYGASLNFGGSGNSWGDTSDERIKKDVRNIDIGLDFINKLRPIKYKDVNPSDYPVEIRDRSFFDRTDSSGKAIPAFEKKEIPEPDKEMVGFLAQEVKATMDELGINFSGWEQEEAKEYGSTPLTDEQKAKGGTQRLQYSRFVVPLIKAVQELSAKVEALENA